MQFIWKYSLSHTTSKSVARSHRAIKNSEHIHFLAYVWGKYIDAWTPKEQLLNSSVCSCTGSV